VNSIQHEFVNSITVRLNWSKHPFSVQVRLKNLETNFSSSPTENNQTSALFIHLAEASIYQVEFNISKENYSSIIQMADYFIKTGEHFPIS
jgi:heme-binding NEAT domain protein